MERFSEIKATGGMWIILLAVVSLIGGATTKISCGEARMKCAYRVGCGMALQNYMVRCSEVLEGPFPQRCPEVCQHSLIALVSTEEGMELMDCDCSDEECVDKKERTDVCRPDVALSMSRPVLTCRVAQWICSADALCSTALQYYNLFCKAMFTGKKCTARCHNSIKILRRQEKAAKLFTCKCDGREDYDCQAIQKNMNKLCFRKHPRHHNHSRYDDVEHQTPGVVLPADDSSGRSSSGCAAVSVTISALWLLAAAAGFVR